MRDHLVSAKQLRRLLAKWIPIDRFEQFTGCAAEKVGEVVGA